MYLYHVYLLGKCDYFLVNMFLIMFLCFYIKSLRKKSNVSLIIKLFESFIIRRRFGFYVTMLLSLAQTMDESLHWSLPPIMVYIQSFNYAVWPFLQVLIYSFPGHLLDLFPILLVCFHNDLLLAQTNKSQDGLRSVQYHGAKCWNDVYVDIKWSPSVKIFREKFEKFLFERIYW